MEEQTNQTKQPKRSFFGKVKDFFSAKPKEQENAPRPISEPTRATSEPTQRKIRYEECFWCKNAVYEDEHYSNQQGRNFHRKCYKKFLQAGARGKI
jgi:hypothetical protein